ncbi:ATP cone domain-containing protein [Clostridium sp. USBA 49]|jgi:transcriptional regulator NrdR family protein|uniref:ATP cone domain-containing protein n=1 Tax=Clostridium TaxID=1485 RepID=UPI00099A2AE4|nr:MULTISPECIES: ATP cone domain-containing protein [Clostridium]SKA79074.1 ATP cone domain-containing protein [Clostridium sp. USBA 49]
MQIIKKDGRIEKFDINKLKASIENSANDINFPITESDLNIVLNDIKKILNLLRENSSLTSSYEVRGIVYHVLINSGFSSVCKSYMDI